MARVKKTTVTTVAASEAAVEPKPGLSLEDGIVLSTTVVLLIAVVLAYLQYSSFYGT